MVFKRVMWLLVGAVLILAVAPALAQDNMMHATVNMGGNDELGPFFVDANGMTLYIFAMDEPGVSNCSGDCVAKWPLLTVAAGENPTLADGIPGLVNVITRDDGTRQVTYNGMPLYYWVNDAQPGDATGQNVGEVWFVATPPTVGLGGNTELGDFLVGANGMTLYLFTNDTENTSNCYDQCAANWPPLTVANGDLPTGQPGLPGKLGVIDRTDGIQQVTYDGMPLYYWVKDAAPGDATGQNVNNVWFVVKPPTVSLSSNADLGDYLIGPNGMTLYIFTKDTDGASTCYDQCAVKWPPLLAANGETLTAGEGVMGELGTTERTDGTYQVTYNGMPLYYWIDDIVPGDTTGQDVGAVWFVTH